MIMTYENIIIYKDKKNQNLESSFDSLSCCTNCSKVRNIYRENCLLYYLIGQN